MITYPGGGYSYDEYIDCGIYDQYANSTKNVIIVDCMPSIIMGYICEAGIPDQEAYDIHPYIDPVANKSVV